MRGARILSFAAAVLVGFVPAFFFVFAGVFTDPGGLDERLVSLALVIVSYAALGFLFARFLPGGTTIGLALASSAILILALYSTRETQNLGLHLVYLLCAVAPAVGAAWLGANRRRPEKSGFGEARDLLAGVDLQALSDEDRHEDEAADARLP